MRPEVVVTGSTGFVGSNLCRFFLARGYRVLAIKGPSTQSWRLERDPLLQIAEVDLRSSRAVQRLIRRAQPRFLINCAAYGAYSSQSDVEEIYRVNLHAVRYLLEALIRAGSLRAFIQAGTSSEYGFNSAGPSEDAPTLPDSHYAVSKVAATALCRFYAAKYGLPVWCLRFYSIYGPLEDGSRLIPTLLNGARQGRLPPLVQPDISRDFVFVDDACRAVERVLKKSDQLTPGEIYNIGTGVCTTLRDLVSLARKLFHIAEQPKWGSMTNRHWDHPRWFGNPTKARRRLGWKPAITLDKGLCATMAWMQSNPHLLELVEKNTVLHRRANG